MRTFTKQGRGTYKLKTRWHTPSYSQSQPYHKGVWQPKKKSKSKHTVSEEGRTIESLQKSPSSITLSFDNKLLFTHTYESIEEKSLEWFRPGTQDMTSSTNISNLSFRFESGAHVIPHPAKAYKGGEDAHFLTSKVLGVADGVGGWADVGVDPALYSNSLMQGCQLAVEKDVTAPLQVLQEGYEYSKEIVGSSTACIVSLDESTLHAANLGDSGFIIVRDFQVVFRTKEQQHSFNFPYQLGAQSTTTPEHADLIEVPVKDGDLLVMGSDGLFDNLFDEEIVNIIKNSLNDDPSTSAEDIAHNIASAASFYANQSSRVSPFAKAAHQSGHFYFMGGKVDDITVVVSRIRIEEMESPSSLAKDGCSTLNNGSAFEMGQVTESEAMIFSDDSNHAFEIDSTSGDGMQSEDNNNQDSLSTSQINLIDKLREATGGEEGESSILKSDIKESKCIEPIIIVNHQIDNDNDDDSDHPTVNDDDDESISSSILLSEQVSSDDNDIERVSVEQQQEEEEDKVVKSSSSSP